MSDAPQPTRVFFCYAREDTELLTRLEDHLSLLVRNGLITTWHEGQVLPGQHRDSVVDAEIQRADIVLLLISASFLQCDNCYNIMMSRALERHAKGEALVIPVLLRPVAWEDAPFSELVCLPSNRLAVTLWHDMDEALRNVVLGIQSGLDARALRKPFGLPEPYPEDRASSDTRRVDAAVPANVIVREPCEVLAMVAKSSSDGLRALLRVDPRSFPVTPEDVRSSQFEIHFPVDARGRRQAATVTVALESRDFDPPLTFKKVLVPPNSDSTVCTLFVTPMRAGTLSLQLEVRLGDVTVWSLRLRTNAADAGAPRSPGYLLASVPLSTVVLDVRSGEDSLGTSSHGTVVVPLSATPSGGGRRLLIPKQGDLVEGRFYIVERLGAGGMGVVFLVQDTITARDMALKFITHEVLGVAGSEVIERFKSEVLAIARLSHENIVCIYDWGISNGVPFLTMEHLEGRPLDSIEMHQELDALRAVRMMAGIARGLSHAHRAGIVHRNLKPSNVFIEKDGRATIVDFSLASVAFGLDSRSTEWHALAGTPRYMSPEQWKGEAQDCRTDIWAVGVMLFEMLAGCPPFRGESIFEVRNQVLSPQPAPPLRTLRPSLPEEAGRLVELALTKDLSKRLSSADELLDRLIAIETALTRTVPTSRSRMDEG